MTIIAAAAAASTATAAAATADTTEKEEFLSPEQLYDALGATYQARYGGDPEPLHYLSKLHALLPASSSILDAGCGTGRPAAAYLVSQGHRVTGIDVSSTMLDLARAQVVPNANEEGNGENGGKATFIKADMNSWMPPGEMLPFDAVVAYFSLAQQGPDGIADMLRRFSGWVRQGSGGGEGKGGKREEGGWLLLGTVLAEDAGAATDEEVQRFRRGEGVVNWLKGYKVKTTALSEEDWIRLLEEETGWEVVMRGSGEEVVPGRKTRGSRMRFYIAKRKV